MELLSVLAAVGASLLVIASVLPGDGVRERVATGSVLLVAALASWYVGSQFWDRISGLRDQRAEFTPLSQAAAATRAAPDVNTDFLHWASARIEPHERFYLFPSGPQSDAGIYQWTTYQLTPRVSVSSPDEADALIFYDVDPRETDWSRSEFGPPKRYDAGFAVARRKAVR